MKANNKTSIILCLSLLLYSSVFTEIARAEAGQGMFKSDFIRIYEDNSGISHVVASSSAGLYWGFGYCTARDRMFQLELLRRSINGRLSEIFGEDFVEADTIALRDGVSDAEIEEGLMHIDSAFKEALEAFTSGINEAIDRSLSGKAPLDQAFRELKILPSRFSTTDVIQLFVGTMAVRYNDFTQELENRALLKTLTAHFGARNAARIFDDVVFFNDPSTFTTLEKPAERRHHPGVISKTRRIRSSHEPGTGNLSGTSGIMNRHTGLKSKKALKSIGLPTKSGSYAVALSNRAFGANEAFLLGGPQMGYFNPSALYAIGLHSPDFDIVGTTPVGYFVLLFAANRKIAFTATAGVGNNVDIIRASADHDSPFILHCEGDILHRTVKQMEIPVKNGTTRKLELAETTIGPVVAHEGKTFFIKQRGWKNRTVDSYAAWFASNHAKNLEEWADASDRLAISINWIGADRQGRIAYIHCGTGKTRPDFGNDRLPGSEIRSFPFPDSRLSGSNPENGYLINWNCSPEPGFRNGDLQTGWGGDQRSAFIRRLLAETPGPWSTDTLKHIDRKIAFQDLRAFFFKSNLVALITRDNLSEAEHDALMLLEGWDGSKLDENADGIIDHKGAAIFESLWNVLFFGLFHDVLGDFIWMIESDATWTQTSLLARALTRESRYDYLRGRDPGTVVTEAFKSAVIRTTDDSGEIRNAQMPGMVFPGVNHVGAPTQMNPVSIIPFMNRGSDVQIIQLSPKGIRVSGVLPPGNKVTGKSSDSHIDDFRMFRYKNRPLTLNDLNEVKTGVSFLRPNCGH